MTDKEMRNLRDGDIVRGKFSGDVYVVTGNYGDRVTAVRTADITHADEWELIVKGGVSEAERHSSASPPMSR